jgi:hypothetical protein
LWGGHLARPKYLHRQDACATNFLWGGHLARPKYLKLS